MALVHIFILTAFLSVVAKWVFPSTLTSLNSPKQSDRCLLCGRGGPVAVEGGEEEDDRQLHTGREKVTATK